jgi:DNA-binding response OmpR family regulator
MTDTQIMLGKKVVLIADDLAFANSLERIFNFAGVDILVCNTQEKGISVIKTEKPDLLIIESSSHTSAENIISIAFFKESYKPPMLFITDDKGLIPNTNPNNYLEKEGLELVKVIEKIESIFDQETAPDNKNLLDITEHSQPLINTKVDHVKVLLVEDDPLLRNLLSIRFTKGNIPYQLCHNGNDVLNTILEYKPTIVILDIMLPGKNGLEVLEEIRQIPAVADISVIVFSNKDNDEDRKKAKDLSVDTFLIKAMTDLNDLIRIILEKSK